MSTQFNCQKAIQFSQTVLIQTIQLSIVFVHTKLNVKTVLFQTIHFCIITLMTLPLQARVDLGVMTMKGYSAFSSIIGTSPLGCLVSLNTRREGLTPLQRSSQCILQHKPTGQK